MLRCVGRNGRKEWEELEEDAKCSNIVERDELAATVKQVEREGFCCLFTISRGLTLYIKLLQMMQAIPSIVV